MVRLRDEIDLSIIDVTSVELEYVAVLLERFLQTEVIGKIELHFPEGAGADISGRNIEFSIAYMVTEIVYESHTVVDVIFRGQHLCHEQLTNIVSFNTNNL